MTDERETPQDAAATDEQLQADWQLYQALRAFQDGKLEPLHKSTCVGNLDPSLTALNDHLRGLLRAAEERGRRDGIRSALQAMTTALSGWTPPPDRDGFWFKDEGDDVRVVHEDTLLPTLAGDVVALLAASRHPAWREGEGEEQP